MVKSIVTLVIAAVIVDLTVTLAAKGYTFAAPKVANLFKKGAPVIA